MYDELVKRLREEAREADTFELMNELFDAADAIEKLALNQNKTSFSDGKTSKEETE